VQRRRRFLKVLAAGSLGACAPDEPLDETDPSTSSSGAAGGDGPGDLPAGYLFVGEADDLPVDSLIAHPTLDLFVGRDAAGVYVMTSRCTHQSCNMIANQGVAPDLTITCGCHFSRFDRFGAVLNGPATMTLPHFHVIVTEDGVVGVDLNQLVDVDFRASVP
jgi:Rieske Fe-S protein